MKFKHDEPFEYFKTIQTFTCAQYFDEFYPTLIESSDK